MLLRRAIRRAFHAVRNLLVLFLLVILMPQDQLQGRVLLGTMTILSGRQQLILYYENE